MNCGDKKKTKKTPLTPGKIALKTQGMVLNFATFMAKAELPQSFINRHRSQGISAGIERFFLTTLRPLQKSTVLIGSSSVLGDVTQGEKPVHYGFWPIKTPFIALHSNRTWTLYFRRWVWERERERETTIKDIKTTFTLSLASMLLTTDPCFFL